VHVNTQIENPFVLKVDSVEVSPKEVGGAVFTVAPAIRFEKSELVAQGEVYHSAGHAPVSNLGKAYPS
jgi:hypothetical protein